MILFRKRPSDTKLNIISGRKLFHNQKYEAEREILYRIKRQKQV